MNKKYLTFIITLVVISLCFSIISYAGDFDTPIIPIPGSNKTSENNDPDPDDGFTTPIVPGGGETDPTKAPTTTTTTKAKTTTKAAVKKPAATKIKKINSGKKALRVYYNKVKGIKGYQVQIAEDKKFKKKKKTFTVKAKYTNKKITGLKSKKKYFIRVRTYKRVGKKNYYSKWSPVKYRTTK